MTTPANQQRHILDPEVIGALRPVQDGRHILDPEVPGALETGPGDRHILDIPELQSQEPNVLDTPEVQHTNPFADLPTGSAIAIEEAAQQTIESDAVTDTLMAQTSESVNPTLNVVDEAAQAHENQSVQNVFDETSQAVNAQDVFSQITDEQDGFGVQLDLQEQMRATRPVDRIIVEAAESYKESAAAERKENSTRALVAGTNGATTPTTPTTPTRRGRGGANMRPR